MLLLSSDPAAMLPWLHNRSCLRGLHRMGRNPAPAIGLPAPTGETCMACVPPIHETYAVEIRVASVHVRSPGN